jgi:hypothetical protein
MTRTRENKSFSATFSSETAAEFFFEEKNQKTFIFCAIGQQL